MSLFDSISDAAEWRTNPVRNAGRAGICLVAPFVCIGEHGGQRARELTATAVEAAETIAGSVAAGASGNLLNLVENLPSTDDIVAVGGTIEDILMWVSVIGGILLAIILIGVVLFYVH